MGSVLATLAFVLAFSFSMAASRFDLRKQNVLVETNVINTAYMRADLLDPLHKTEAAILNENASTKASVASTLPTIGPGEVSTALWECDSVYLPI